MSEQVTKAASLKDIEAVRDLFARAHDYIAQSSHPGHMSMKIGEVLNFLAFQYNDFKLRGENLAKVIENEAKAALNVVDVEAAQNAVDAELVGKKATPASLSDEHGSADAPKA